MQFLTWLQVSDYRNISLIFGTLKDGSLQINGLPINNCFIYRNVFQNDVNSLSKIVLKTKQKQKRFPVLKVTILYISDHSILFKSYQHAVQTRIK